MSEYRSLNIHLPADVYEQSEKRASEFTDYSEYIRHLIECDLQEKTMRTMDRAYLEGLISDGLEHLFEDIFPVMSSYVVDDIVHTMSCMADGPVSIRTHVSHPDDDDDWYFERYQMMRNYLRKAAKVPSMDMVMEIRGTDPYPESRDHQDD